MPILFFRVGYMKNYDGSDEITGGGAYIGIHNEGGEMWNFREEDGRCYGFVMTRNFVGIDLSRLNETRTWKSNDELEGVDIIFIAKNPPHGQVIIGWYKNATVFHRNYRFLRESQNKGDWGKSQYICKVDSDNAILLPEQERNFVVPHGKGFPGQANVWYADAQNDEIVEFLDSVQDYINQWQNPNPATNNNGNRGKHYFPDKELIARIEQVAIDITWAHYENIENPYTLMSVEKDNRGWDLEAKRNLETLYLEVKGHIGNVIQFELTPNEYAKMQEHSKIYRLCVVRNALAVPNLVVFTPKIKKDGWYLVSEKGNQKVKLSEKIAAKASEVEDYD